MNINKRINDFTILGKVLRSFGEDKNYQIAIDLAGRDFVNQLNESIESDFHYNGWFVPKNIRKAMVGLAYMLEKEKLEKWIEQYSEIKKVRNPFRVGIVMAGNIPLVGFHDLLSVLISGNNAVIKMSSSDNRLLPQILSFLSKINPVYSDKIELVDGKLTEIDAIIATGSTNTSRYFDYYFKKYPHIIRKNRNAVAILDGNEKPLELKGLAEDIFSFFGLGCRNVSKVYIPEKYDLNQIFKQLYPFHEIINHNKYANNFDYNRTIMMLNDDDILENGFVIFKSSTDIASPIASIYYQRYIIRNDLNRELQSRGEEIQCIVSLNDIPFGRSQYPELWDYADGVDTLAFLTNL